MAYKKRLYGTRLDKIQEEMDNEVRLVEDVAKENMNSKYVEIAPIKSNTTSKNSSKKTTEWKKGKNEKTQKSLISNTNSKSNNLLALTVDRKNGLSLIKDTTTGRTFLGANNEKKSVLDKTSITNKILGVNNTNNFNSTWNYGTSTKKDVTETTEDIAPVKTTTKREGTGTTNEEGYTYTGRNWGDYWYQAYSTNKDLKIYEKDGKYFVQYSDGKYQNVDNISFMTTKEANTKALEEAKKLGYKANTSNLSISNQIKLDTANLTSEEQQEYTEDLIRQQKDKLEDLERKNKVHTGGNGVRGAIGGIKAYASNLIESIDNNIVEPIANAKDNYNVGKMTEALGMEAYKKMMGEENNYDELKEEYDKFITFNEDIVSEGNYLDQTIQTLPNQIGGLAAGIKRGGLSSAAGAILGGAVGAVTTKTPQGAAAGATTGAKWLGGAGYVTGQSDYTYKLESGLQYQTLIDMGVPEDIAKKEAQDTGVVNALIESGESILDLFTLGSVSKLKDVFTGNLIKKYGEETVSKWVGKSVVKNALSEGAEEATQEAVSIHNEKQATKQAGIERDDSQDKKRIVESAIVGALAGGISDGGVTAATGITKTGINTIKQKNYTQNEQKVIDSLVNEQVNGIAKQNALENELNKAIESKETEQGGILSTKEKNALKSKIQAQIDSGEIDISSTKVSNKDISKIREAVEENMQKGLLDTNTIESVLGTNTDLSNDGYLQKSYIETAKKKEAFTYENKITDAKEKAVYESAAKYFNNTTRSHEFVERVAKISKDKGTNYGFINNEELQTLGHDVEGKQVNGLVRTNKNGEQTVLINVDSPKALETIVGHETTHLLEGTQEYKDLQEAIFNYAKEKGDFNTRQEALNSLYEGIENANVDSELTADLVGDYLFTDTDFINSLSTQKPTVFQRIKEVIDDLVVRFTGTKEEKALREVQKKFKEAYKQNVSNTNENVDKYSLNKMEVIGGIYKNVSLKKGEPSQNKKKLEEYVKKNFPGYDIEFDIFNDTEFTIKSITETSSKENTKSLNDEINFKHNERPEYDSKEWTDLEDIRTRIETLTKELDKSGEFGDYGVDYEESHASLDATYIKLEDNEGETRTIRVANHNDSTGWSDYHLWLSDYKSKTELINDLKKLIYDIRDGKSEIKYSLTDNKGRELTQEQQEYFKDSKVRDENGNLKIMYHGTPKGGFTIFDKNKFGERDTGFLGEGFYFTEDYDDAEGYATDGVEDTENSEIKEVYLNMKNPYIVPKETPYGSDMLEKILEVRGKHNIQSKLKSMGYDGIIYANPIHNEYVVFNENQIKNVDNTKPTTDADIRYSLSEDNKGNELKPTVQKWAEKSKARDENGNLKVLYHGTATGEFTVFDKSKANPEGDWGAGFYLTDNESDVETNYEDGGPDFDNRVSRLAEQIEQEEDIDYDEAEEKAREQLYKGGYKITAYVNMENPAIVGQTYLFNQEDYYDSYNMEDFDSEEEYYEAIEQLVSDDIDSAIWAIEREYDFYNGTDDIRNLLYEAFYEGGIEIQNLKDRLGELYLETDEGLVGHDTARIIIESLGYDGIIDPTVSTKWNMSMDSGTTHYIAFKPNQIKNITNENPTEHDDINLSLSQQNEAVTKNPNLTYGEDVKLQVEEAIAPLKEQINELTEQLANNTTDNVKVSENPNMEQMAPISKPVTQEEIEQLSTESLNSFTDKDVAPEMEQETYYLPDTMTMDNKSLKMLVKNIKTELNLDKTQVAELENAIQEFSTSETVTKEDLYNTIKNKFSEQSIEYKNEEVATIKNLLRNYPIQVSDNVKAEFSSSKTDGFNKVRQKNFNKLKFTNTGTPVDVAYQELNEIYPEFFPSNITNEGDQLKHIIDVANYNTIDVEKFVLDDETINSIVEFVYDSIQDYKFDRYVKDTETFNKAANKALTDKDIPTDMLDIGPVVSNSKITAPVKENALNSQKTVQELGEKNNYISNKADELYTELKGLKKGVRASEELGTILDLGYEWRRIKNALLNIKYKPDSIVDINSSIESTIREMIGRDYEAKYENMMYGLEQPNQNLSIKESNALKLKNLEQSIKKYNNDAQESLELFDELILEKKQQYSELKRKDTNKANNLLQQITNLETRRDNIQVEYERKMNNVQKRIDNMNSKDFKTAEQRMTKQQEYREQARELIGDTSTWKDKKLGIQYQINTFKRNLRDIVKDAFGKADIQKADAIYEEYPGKYNQNEAKLKVESNKIKQPYVDLNLTKQEDAYVQMLGEFKYNPDTTITKKVVDDYYNEHKDKIDINKVDKAIESARKTYDSLLERLNEVLRNQGMKEIGYRQGYFPHFTEEKQSMLAKLFDWKVHNNQIPTDIAGLTELNNPERSWQSFNKQRKGDTTDYSFSKGLDTYVHGALDWIYHIEDIQKRRALENEIRYQHSEKGIQEKIEAIYNNPDLDADEIQTQIEAVYGVAKNPLNNFVTDLRNSTNNLAGKKSTLDRSMEYATNRQIYSTMTNLSNRVSGNLVGGSISSALTNFIPITQSWAEVSPLSSLNATREVLKNTIKDDGTIAKSTFLTNRLVKEENLYKSGWDKARDFISAISTDAIDSFTSQVVWRSKYNENIKNGMNEFDAIANADQFAENVMAGRSRGNQPTIFDSKNPITKMFTSFQLEVNNGYQYMFKDMPIDIGNKSKAKLIKGYATMFLGAYVYNALYSTLTGRDAAFDPIGIVEDILKELGIGGDDEDEKSASEKFTAITEDLVQDLPFVGGLFGGGRVPISAAIPYDNPIKMFSGTATDALDAIAPIFNKDEEVKEKGEKALKDLTSEWLKPVTYLALPFGGGQISKSIKGLSMYDSDLPIAGSYNNSGDLRFTADDSLPGIAKSFLFGQYASESAQDYVDSGFKTIGKDNVEEMISLDMDSTEYRNYRNGLNKNEKVGEKLAYINSLDVTDKQKIIMIDYVASRGEDEEDFVPNKGKGKLEVTDNYIVAGNREYYKYIDNEGNEKWSKVDEEEAADLNSLGFSASGKNTYFSIKEEISSIANEYLENKDYLSFDNGSDEYKEAIKELSSDKKASIIDKIKNTGLNDKQKAYLYGKYYSSDETLEKVTNSGISFDNYLNYEKDSLSLESTEEKVEYLYNSKMTDDAKTAIYETSVLTGFDNEDKCKDYKTAKAAGIDIDSWLSYKKQEFVADKDSSGKSISGSRKDKIFNYINSLSLSIPQKAILFRQEYPSDDTYNNQIVNYVGSLNISYEDKVNIFEELDMTVGSDGRVYWK